MLSLACPAGAAAISGCRAASWAKGLWGPRLQIACQLPRPKKARDSRAEGQNQGAFCHGGRRGSVATVTRRTSSSLHAVAAQIFRGVQRAIGALEQRFERLVAP